MSINEMAAKVRQLKELQALIEEATAEAETIKDELKALMKEKNANEMTVDIYKLKYITVKSNRFDSLAFKKAHSDLYNQYTKETETKRFSIA